jgi:transcriptional regulator with XRE-family HTH domain
LTKSVYTARYKRLREMLIVARQEADLTQIQLANAIGRPQSFVSKVESGERRLDVIEVLEVLTALGVDPLEFLQKLLQRRR